jgi:hypothetical protein
MISKFEYFYYMQQSIYFRNFAFPMQSVAEFLQRLLEFSPGHLLQLYWRFPFNLDCPVQLFMFPKGASWLLFWSSARNWKQSLETRILAKKQLPRVKKLRIFQHTPCFDNGWNCHGKLIGKHCQDHSLSINSW